MNEPNWWKNTVGYNIYPRTFCDSTGDGNGDIAGIISKLDYVQWLGVDFIWINPIFESPQLDGGYDVANYYKVDPMYGDNSDLENLIEECHSRDMKLVLDIVPNHTSFQHEWFLEAKQSRDSKFQDYYHFLDPKDAHAEIGSPESLPNNWLSVFGGPAWTFNEETEQYYLHIFDKSQPDLNWESQAVRDEFEKILRFWFDMGADGFRVDVTHGCKKDSEYRDTVKLDKKLKDDSWNEYFNSFDNTRFFDAPGNTTYIYPQWRKIADEYNAMLLGETYIDDYTQIAKYVEKQDGMHESCIFPLAGQLWWDEEEIDEHIEICNSNYDGGWAWVIDSHDVHRSVDRWSYEEGDYQSRIGDSDVKSKLDVGRARMKQVLGSLMEEDGIMIIFQGMELALSNNMDLNLDQIKDPACINNDYDMRGCRDVARCPIPWDVSLKNNGFSEGDDLYLPAGQRDVEESIKYQRENENSFLHSVRKMIADKKA